MRSKRLRKQNENMDEAVYKPGMGEEFFYHLGKAAIEDVSCELTLPIKPEVLARAAKRAVGAFPMFGMRPCLDNGGKLYLMQNNAPLKIWPEKSGPVCLGSDDTDGYMFRLLYTDRTVRVQAHHSLGDARIILGFLNTVVYYYLKEQGITVEDPQNLLYKEEDAEDPTLSDSLMEMLKETETEPPRGEYIPQNVFEIPELKAALRMADEKKEIFCYRISFSEKDLLGRVRETGGTPSVLFAAVIGRAIYGCYEVKDRQIVAGIPVDLREACSSRSQCNFIGNVRLGDLAGMAERPFDEQVRALKESLGTQLYLPNILSRVKKLIPVVEAVNSRPLATGRSFSSEKSGSLASQTFLLTNSGRIRLPEGMQAYVTGYDIPLDMDDRCTAAAFSYGGKSVIRWIQPFREDTLVQAVCAEFVKQGIPVVCGQKEKLVTDLVLYYNH